MSFGVLVGAGASIGGVPAGCGFVISGLLHNAFLHFATVVNEVSGADEGMLFGADFEDGEVDVCGAGGDDGEFGAAVSSVKDFDSLGIESGDDGFHGFQQSGGVAEVASFDVADEWFAASGFGHGAEGGDHAALDAFEDCALFAEWEWWLFLIDCWRDGQRDGLQSQLSGRLTDSTATHEAGCGVTGVVCCAGSGGGVAVGDGDFVSVILQFAGAGQGDEQVFAPEWVGGVHDDRTGRWLSGDGGSLRELQNLFAFHVQLLLSLLCTDRSLRRPLRACLWCCPSFDHQYRCHQRDAAAASGPDHPVSKGAGSGIDR